MAIEASEVRGTINHGSGVYEGCRSRQESNMNEGLHRRVRDPIGGIATIAIIKALSTLRRMRPTTRGISTFKGDTIEWGRG